LISATSVRDRSDHLGGVGLALVGGDLDHLGFVDDVIVGHGVAVGGDEEAGALAVTRLRPPGARLIRKRVVGQPEAAEEALHSASRLERRIFVVAAKLITRGPAFILTRTEMTAG
jgi:hypothetical protein